MHARPAALFALAALALPVSVHAGSGWTNTFPPGNGLNGTVRALLSFDDGSGPALYVGGDFTTAGGIPANHVAKWDGGAWSSVGLGTDGPVHALVVFDDGTGPALHVGGDFLHAGSAVANRIAKWDGNEWFHLGSWTDEVVRSLTVANVAGGGPKLYAGGASGVARWTGTSWTPLPSGFFSFNVNAILPFNDGGGEDLYAATDERNLSPGGTYRWDGTSWTVVGQPEGYFRSLASFDGDNGPRLYRGGGPVAWLSGSNWITLGSGVAGHSIAVHDDGNGDAIYADARRWNGTSWDMLGAGVSGGVYAMASFDDGTGDALYVGGDLTTAGGQPVEGLAVWCCAPPQGIAFCFGTETACPCEAGLPGAGCQTAGSTGGVSLSVLSQSTQPNGAILVGQGYPTMSAPTALVIRSPSLDPNSPVTFGDGLRCVSTAGLVRLAASVAVSGVSTHVIGHNAVAGPGVFYYQLWFRDTPSTYCNPSAAFNLSSGRTLTW